MFKELGRCSGCGDFFKLDKFGGISKHKIEGSEDSCSGSGYSPHEIKYVVEDSQSAIELAKIILDDNNVCLQSRIAHSLSCGDGDRCAEERLLRAQALARYVLDS